MEIVEIVELVEMVWVLSLKGSPYISVEIVEMVEMICALCLRCNPYTLVEIVEVVDYASVQLSFPLSPPSVELEKVKIVVTVENFGIICCK